MINLRREDLVGTCVGTNKEEDQIRYVFRRVDCWNIHLQV
jgi:hypothetical protein